MKLKAVDIAKTGTASSIVFDALRQAIIDGELAEGTPLRQAEIAKMFNTSQIPVREAISRLAEQGLVHTQRYKGAVVARVLPDEAAEIFDFRIRIEPAIVRNAVPLMSEELLKEARHYCEAFSASENPMEWGHLNREFHNALYRATDMTFHLEMLDNAINRLDRYLRAQLVLSDGMVKANDEHSGILEACEAGDPELAAERTLQHVSGARQSLLEHLRQNQKTN